MKTMLTDDKDLLDKIQNKMIDIVAHLDKQENLKAMDDFINAHPSLVDALEEAVAQLDTEAIVTIATMIEALKEVEPLDMSEVLSMCDA